MHWVRDSFSAVYLQSCRNIFEHGGHNFLKRTKRLCLQLGWGKSYFFFYLQPSKHVLIRSNGPAKYVTWRLALSLLVGYRCPLLHEKTVGVIGWCKSISEHFAGRLLYVSTYVKRKLVENFKTIIWKLIIFNLYCYVPI